MPIAATDSPAPHRPLRILLSYHYFKEENIRDLLAECFEGIDIDVFADSGAYSAWTCGEPITVDEYCEWLEQWRDCFSCAAALDVIGDAAASWRQTEQMRGRLGDGVDLLPVFHSNDGGGWKWLDRYLDAGYKYIGISPTGAMYANAKLWQGWTAECFRRRPDDVRYHGFGVTGWRIVRAFPWYSVDSSSWAACFRYARLILFDPKSGMVTVRMRSRKELLKNAALLRSYGLTPKTAHADHYDRWQLVRVCVEAWSRAELALSKSKVYTDAPRIYLGMHTNQSPDGNRKGMRAMSVDIQTRIDALKPPLLYMAMGAPKMTNTSPTAVGEALKQEDNQ